MTEVTATNEIASDLQVLLDKDAIKELVYRWDYLTDERFSSDELIERFCTDDVVYDAGPLGRAEGKEAFKAAAEKVWSDGFLFTRHMRHNPVIAVDGDEATGKWYAEIPSITIDDEALWIQGTYELGFRRVDGEWKISKYTFAFTYATPYEKGWVKQPFVEGMPGELEW